jgi:histidinol-phosphate/aromatic aminotransferase/cobyric acid decarboxylase-like protein
MSTHAVHGGDFFQSIGVELDHLERHTAVINADVLDAWYDPSPRVLAAMSQHLAWLIKTSPPTRSEGLRAAIAEVRKVPQEQVVVGGGSSALIFSAFPLLFAGKKVGILDPMYGEYQHVLEKVGASVHRFELDLEHFVPDIDALTRFASRLDGLVIVNPNSPTGVGCPLDQIRSLLHGLPESVTVWIDETYIDFMEGAQTAEPLVAEYSNLIISKSLSKVYALSGVRAGYLVCDPERAREIDGWIPPWSVGLLGQLAAIEALRDRDYYEARINKTHDLRKTLSEGLEGLGFRVVPAHANFCLARLPYGSATQLCEICSERGVFLRRCNSLSPRFRDDTIRVAVKTESEIASILSTISDFFTQLRG